MQHCAISNDRATNSGDYHEVTRRFAEVARKDRSEGQLRGLIHNQTLHANAHIARHGGFQMDMFADNETGLDLPATL